MVEFASIATCDEVAILGEQLGPLRPAARIEHQNGSLLAHLVGVWRVLCAGRAHREVARAGLIHSAYSTQFFKTRLFEPSERRKIARIYGECAENLAWLFCRIDRPLLWEMRPRRGFVETVFAVDHETQAMICLEAKIANELFLLECANFIDQGYPGQSIGAYHAWALSLTKFGVGLNFFLGQSPLPLSEEAEVAAIESYLPEHGVALGLEGLKQAARDNPFAAEPLILSASIAATEGRFSDGWHDLAGAQGRLPIFGASWDKRLSWPEWVAITDALARSFAERRCPSIQGEPTNLFAMRDWAISEEFQ